MSDKSLVTYDDIQAGDFAGKTVCIEAMVWNVVHQSYGIDFDLWYHTGETYVCKENCHVFSSTIDEYPDVEPINKIVDGDVIRYATDVYRDNSFGIASCYAVSIVDHYDLSPEVVESITREENETAQGFDSPDVKAEWIIRSRIRENYTNTTVDSITINEDLGTEADGDYVALVYLTWDTKNTGPTAKQVLKLYSDDLAATVAVECPNVQEIAIFWTASYLDAGAKCSYERRDGGMYEMDMVWDSVFNG